MKCSWCLKDFPEKEIQESHDVPCYLFWKKGKTRRERKHFADKYPRRWLCNECHEEYEDGLILSLITTALRYSKRKYGGGDGSI